MNDDAQDVARRRLLSASWLVDVGALGAVVVVFWIPSIFHADTIGHQVLGTCLSLVMSCAIMARWKFPVASVLIALGSTIIGWLMSATTDPMIGVAWCLYPLALQQKPQRQNARTAIPGVLVISAFVVGLGAPTEDFLQTVAFGLGAIGFAWLLGRIEAERLCAIRQAARQQVEFEQAQRETAMAREVHDVVGHALSTISAEAGIGRATPNLSRDEIRKTLEDIEHRSRSALEQVQSLVRALRRHDDPARDGEAGKITDDTTISELVAAATVSGLKVDTHIDLPEWLSGREVALVATRVVQEALSNIIRHAKADRCELSVAPDEDNLIVRVDDDGSGMLRDRSVGSGLLGMRERVESVGGHLTVTNRLAGGTRVLARLPLPVQE